MNSFKLAAALAVFALAFSSAPAASFREAKVSEVVQDVSLLLPPSSVKPAAVGDRVAGSTTVRTGVKSRTELTFPDSTLLRLGSNTQFSFINEEREFNLTRGTAVLKTTKKSGGARIRSGGVTAAITGSMAAIAKPPPGQAGVVKLLLFYGDSCLLIPDKKEKSGFKEVCLKPWQMATIAVDKNGNPVGDAQVDYFDAALTASTSNLMDPNEDTLKESLAKIKKALEENKLPVLPANASQNGPVVGLPDAGGQSGGPLEKLLSIFGARPPLSQEAADEAPSAVVALCPDGFFFDNEFQECFPGVCPEGTAFDHISQLCVPVGGGAIEQQGR